MSSVHAALQSFNGNLVEQQTAPATPQTARFVSAEEAEIYLRGASLWASCLVYDDPRDDASGQEGGAAC